jgi:hypothetical protein
MKEDLIKFDTSNFNEDNPYGIPRLNKAIPGLMKDENGGKLLWEFVGLRSKMYCNNVEGEMTKKSKGIKQYVVQQELNNQDYKDCLYDDRIILRKQVIFRSILHTIYTQNINKIALSPYDTKRYLIPNSVKTFAWGHKSIPE